MAYGVKYRAEWRATTRGERDYIVEFLQRDYTGDVLPMYLTGECVTITYAELDESELKPIKASEAEITLLCTEEGYPYIDMFTLDPAQYQVVISENGRVIWRGYLATGSYSQPLSKPPYTVRFRANDGMAVLKAMPYLDSAGSRYTVDEPVSGLIRRLLSPISDSVDIWNYNLMYFGQPSPTFDMVSIPESSVYLAFDDGTPTYYDVLEAALKTFGVQLFQQEGTWCVRSLAMLAVATQNKLVKAVDIGTIATDGYGIKADAIMSLLPPLRKMTAPEKASGNAVDISATVCDPNNWITYDRGHGVYDPYRPSFTKYGESLKIISARNAGDIGLIPNAGWNIIPTTISRSDSVRVRIEVDAYNDDEYAVQSLYLGVWLVDATDDNPNFLTWEDRDVNQYTLNVSRTAAYWDAEGNKWIVLDGSITIPSYDALGMQQVTIGKGSASNGRPSLSVMGKTSVSFELPKIPTISNCSRWKLCVVASIFSGEVVYMNSPKVTIEDTNSGETNRDPNISISKDGLSDEAYDARWRTATEVALSADAFSPSLIELESNLPVLGYLDAIDGIADKYIVGKMLYDLRNGVTRDLEGELDKGVSYGLNNVCLHEGRYYYTNYVKQLLKRGIASVQLRELPQLSTQSGMLSHNILEIPTICVGQQKSLYYTAPSGKLFRLDLATNKKTTIVSDPMSSSMFKPQITKGVQCVVYAEASTQSGLDGEDNIGSTKVRAYDDEGNLIAQVVNFSDDDISPINWVKTARYDAVSQVWLASNGGRKVVMCDSRGYIISRFETDLPVNPKLIDDVEIMPYNGGFVYRYYAESSSASGYFSFWHCYSIHKAGKFESGGWAMSQSNIRFVTERYIAALGNTGQNIIYKIEKTDWANAGISLAITISSTNEIIAMNSGLILTRGASGAAIYDTRNTAVSKYYNLSLGDSSSIMALCGDIVYVRDVTIATRGYWKRILPKISSVNGINIIDDEQL